MRFMDVCRKLAPEDCACDWDNPGLLAGRSDKEVKKHIHCPGCHGQGGGGCTGFGGGYAFDPPSLIFKAIKKVNDQNFITRRLVKLIQADISYYAMHTNFDAARAVWLIWPQKRLAWLAVFLWRHWGDERPGGAVSYGIGKSGF